MSPQRIAVLRELVLESVNKISAAYSAREFEGKRWPFGDEENLAEALPEALDELEHAQKLAVQLADHGTRVLAEKGELIAEVARLRTALEEIKQRIVELKKKVEL